jgi:hypothetical protein
MKIKRPEVSGYENNWVSDKKQYDGKVSYH